MRITLRGDIVQLFIVDDGTQYSLRIIEFIFGLSTFLKQLGKVRLIHYATLTYQKLLLRYTVSTAS